jgi:hypothetical protein
MGDYATVTRGHDAEWLLHQELCFNDYLLRKGRDGEVKPSFNVHINAVGPVPDPDPGEADAARRYITRTAAHLGPHAVIELLAVLGLDDAGEAALRTCQGCKRRVYSHLFADRGDGQPRCPECRDRLPGDPLAEGVKRCSRCKVVKPASEYHANPASSDGLQSRCKRCRAVYEQARTLRRARNR